tara:strand:- start:218 stop:1402 length:1185 start_codon:yes stop_codon:yes gene_type:complete
MGRPTKAQIKYMVGDGGDAVESILRFHSVIAEEHEVTTEVTKFPVQSGFNVSNHAIKKNRKVTISGLISNHLIIGAEEFHEYGGNNTKIVFGTLKDLVRRATPCEVNTNFGDYTPVIFTKFKTKLMSGKTDVMEFTMMGEEVQLGLTSNANLPTLLVFTPLTDAERAARVEELVAIGLEVPEEAEVSQAPVDFNESFQVETTNLNGETSITTYDKTAYDPTTKAYSHEVHTSDTDVAGGEPEEYLNWFGILQEETGIDLEAGAATFSACLSDGLTGLAIEAGDELIETALGNLKKSTYGAAYGIFGVNGDRSIGQILLSLGVDCLVAGAIGSVDSELNPDDFQENDIPTFDDALVGAASIGDSVVSSTLGVAAPTTLTRISPPSSETSFFGDLL